MATMEPEMEHFECCGSCEPPCCPCVQIAVAEALQRATCGPVNVDADGREVP